MSTESKCSCQFCNGHIAFDTAMAGQTIACPHCGMETKLFIPNTPPGPSPASVKSQSQAQAASGLPNTGSVEIKRGVSPLGIASLVLGIIACIFCWVPLLGILVLPLALIGLLLAMAGLVMAGVNKKTGFAFPVSGLIVCVLSCVIAIAVTGSMALAFAQRQPTNQVEVSNRGSQTSASQSVDWSTSPIVKQGDVQIEIGNIYIEGDQLEINVHLKNTSATKKIDFQTWRGSLLDMKDAAALTDNFGNGYKRIAINPAFAVNFVDEKSIYPSETHHDVLFFEKPVRTLKWLHLELPAENFGGSGAIRFEIPTNRLQVAPF